MKKYKQIVGDFGESLAQKYLITKGYVIIGTKIKSSYQEIDIIAQYQQKIVFVEVKTRISDLLGEAEEAMNGQKLNNLKKAMQEYTLVHKHDFDDVRGDLIAITIDKSKKIANIKHYKDVF